MVEMFKNWMNCQNIVDCWREHHPTEENFTWSRGNIARRLDHILLDPILENKVNYKHEHKNIGFSYHQALSMQK